MSVVNAVNLVEIGPIVLEYRMFKENPNRYIMIISDLSSSHYDKYVKKEATPPDFI